MARPWRIEYDGAFYHVMSRGNEKRQIFRDDRDRKKFLSYLESAHQRYKALFCAYCLMHNHYHLMLETPLGNLSEILHHVNASYTTYYNLRHARVGHLFQGRYYAILVEKDSYALELSRYIHLNPVRKYIVKKPEDYQWSSYRYLINIEEEPSYFRKNMILSYFGQNPEKGYQEFVEEGISNRLENPLRNVVASTILGNEEFVEWVKENYLTSNKRLRDVPARNLLIKTILKGHRCNSESDNGGPEIHAQSFDLPHA